MTYENLLTEIDQGVATITINRPEALNALNIKTLKELECVFYEYTLDDRVKVIILTGSGEKAFIAGADIAAMRGFTPLEARDFSKLGHAMIRSMEACPKPVIAAINGFALGGGCELAMGCDIRLVADTAKFGQPEVNLGLVPGFGGTQRLARLVGRGRAMELILTGDMINAEEAYRIGLANRVVPQTELLSSARSMAAKIISKSPIAVKLAKEALRNGLEMDLDRANQYEGELLGLCFATSDQKEGMQAFLEKRPAKFTGE